MALRGPWVVYQWLSPTFEIRHPYKEIALWAYMDLGWTPPQGRPPLPIKICGHTLVHADLGSSGEGSGPLTTLGPSAAATTRLGELKQPQ